MLAKVEHDPVDIHVSKMREIWDMGEHCEIGGGRDIYKANTKES